MQQPLITQSIVPHTRTLAPGEKFFVAGAPSAEINLWKLAGASEVDIALDNGHYLPTAQGRGYRQPHKAFTVMNNNLATVEFTILQATVPGAFIDNLDTNTAVSINGDIAAVNSPLASKGGDMFEPGTSKYIEQFAAGHGDVWTNIVDASANLNGIIVHYMRLIFDAAPTLGAGYPTYPLMFLLQGGNSNILFGLREAGEKESLRGAFIPSGHSLTCKTFVGQPRGYAECGYTIL